MLQKGGEKINLSEEETLLLSRQAEDRSKTYMLLSTFYLQRPTEEFVRKLKTDEFIQNLKNAISESMGEIKEGLKILEIFANSIKDIPESEVAENLKVDFTRLFRGIKKGYGPPPPYESVWQGETRVMGERTQEVLKKYSDAGIGMDISEELPDYIGIELKFMFLLSYKEAEAWKNNEKQKAINFLKLQQEFMNAHIHKWIPRFCSIVEDEAVNSFYKGVALFTRGFIEIDRGKILETLDFINS